MIAMFVDCLSNGHSFVFSFSNFVTPRLSLFTLKPPLSLVHLNFLPCFFSSLLSYYVLSTVIHCTSKQKLSCYIFTLIFTLSRNLCWIKSKLAPGLAALLCLSGHTSTQLEVIARHVSVMDFHLAGSIFQDYCTFIQV